MFVPSLLLMLAVSASSQAQERKLLLTGEVFSRKAQEIFVPLTTNLQAQISMMVEEGEAVEPGQVIIEFDGAEAARQVEQQREEFSAERAKTERDLARLEKELVQASYALKRARVELALAELRASTPKGLIGSIEYAENQLALERAQKTLVNVKEQLDDKEKGLRERHRQADLDRKKAELSDAWWAEMLESFRFQAKQSGFLIYGNHPWTGSKFQVGDNVQTSFRIAQVADISDLAIKIWINSVDRPHVKAGSPVNIVFDALPDSSFSGRLDSISDSGAKRQEWGKAVYFEGIVSLDSGAFQQLLPGMSALVEVL